MPSDITILRDLCSVPTAPFAEQHVVRYVEQFVAARKKKLRLSRDRFGNRLIELPSSKNPRAPRWVFTAHMDHPGFVATRMRGTRTLEAAFRGWVFDEYVRGASVRFFSGGREVTGVVQTVKVGTERPIPESVVVRVTGPVAPNSPGMFDLGEARVKGNKIYSRAIDDLGGLAATFQMLDDLRRKPPAAPVAVLLTRAEEEGFVGAIAASLKPKLLRKTDRIIAIETSAMQPYAPQGQGAIIRTSAPEAAQRTMAAETAQLAKLMSKIDCQGGNTQIGKVLSEARREAVASAVRAVVFVGDAMEEAVDDLCARAGELGLLKVPVFMFQEGHDSAAEQAFREIARLTGGAWCRFDPGAAAQLRELLRAAAAYAAGGREALLRLSKTGAGAARLIGQMK